ncbi:MAG: bifunctional ADP-dependent (S)-NAD(P)H-hydrate dehydratase/NAD(P)H-hydrate epimerase [Rhizobiales bacterium 68-8]|nr:MAG: bifunctional ADP-dependent (S)-NAD(P)H-hydrate dehydratase/NAD(P)H-hydrate epimerase [Rhizobiales bacterium 68-8]
MSHTLLSPAEMAEADRLAALSGPFDGPALMENAGLAIHREILRRFPDAACFDVLCGPGNNGGDGYVVARRLAEDGLDVCVWRETAPRGGSDAAGAGRLWRGQTRPLGDFAPRPGALVVDALFGAGLSKPLEGAAARAAATCADAGARVVAVDLPSGISGATGRATGPAFRADLTITFFRAKPGHLLQPGRAACGELVVADIGIPASVLTAIAPKTFQNVPALWRARLPRPDVETHKYARGHAAVFSGGPSSTGAARLSAMAAARAGAGAVTVLSPPDALLVNAAHLTAIMVAKVSDAGDVERIVATRKVRAAVLGPGFGVGEAARAHALALLAHGHGFAGLVLDADGITSFRDAPDALFSAARSASAALVLTPHEGEFARLFPDLAADEGLSKLDRARQAAARAHAVVILKGPDTVIAAPDGRAAINANATPWLATAGSGDVLAGIVAGLLAQEMPAWEAACAAVWIHAEAGRRFGPGLVADDLPGLLPPVIGGLLG